MLDGVDVEPPSVFVRNDSNDTERNAIVIVEFINKNSSLNF